MNRIKSVLASKYFGYLKNKYVLTIIVFAFWILVMDQHNLIFQYRLNQELSESQKMEQYYLSKIEEVNKQKEHLFTSSENLIQFAREQYLMKKEHEDIFIIVKESK